MTESATVVSDGVVDSRYHFVLRRLHSLTGLLPVGVFLCEHLFTNAAILRGWEHFFHDVRFIRNLPAIEMMELFGIWLPLAFHAALGFVYIFTGTKMNVRAYPYGSNVRYTLQRWTGVIAFMFIFLHMYTVQWGFAIGSWYTPFAKPGVEGVTDADVANSAAYAMQFAWWVPVMYAIGILSAVFHFANGLWTMAITWGLTVTVGAQRRWGVVCLLIGLVLGAMGIGAMVGFLMHDYGDWPERIHVIFG